MTGRRLASYTMGGTKTSYTYGADGIRTAKAQRSAKTAYEYVNG